MGNEEKALEVFESTCKRHFPTTHVLQSLFDLFSKNRNVEKATAFFDLLRSHSSVTYNSYYNIINLILETGDKRQALYYYQLMIKDGITPTKSFLAYMSVRIPWKTILESLSEENQADTNLENENEILTDIHLENDDEIQSNNLLENDDEIQSDNHLENDDEIQTNIALEIENHDVGSVPITLE